MMGANAYVDIQHSDTTVSLTKLEFDCLKSGISKVKDYYDFLKLLVIDDSDQIDIPFPSHIYANNVLEISSDCFLFAVYHNNKLVVCLKKQSTTCLLSDTLFRVEFHVVQHMLDNLARNYASNWCFYCDQHKSLKRCIVCANEMF